jgi:uncharacterized Zn finger protein (UPF0148 family)
MTWNCKLCGKKKNTKIYCSNCGVSKSDSRQRAKSKHWTDRQDYRIPILKKQISTEKKKLTKLQKKLKQYE